MSDIKTIPIDRTGNWADRKTWEVIRFLDMLSTGLGSRVAEEMSANLRCIVSGAAPIVPTCEHVTAVCDAYPTLCGPCAAEMGVMTPQKFLARFHTDDDGEIWGAVAWSVVFIMKAMGRPNTCAEAVEFLDGLKTEDDVLAMAAFLTKPKDEIAQ